MTQSSVLDAIKGVTDKYDVPIALIASLIEVESAWNSQALGDNGTSYGLFQLHTPGGQGDRAVADGHKPTDLFDPTLNATYGMPSVALAWDHLKASFHPDDFMWWLDFCAQSGHPGGSRTNPATINLATTLQRVYKGVINHAPTHDSSPTAKGTMPPMTIPLSAHGEVADFPNTSQFEYGESAYECVAFSVAICHFAGHVGKGPGGSGEAVDSLADTWYAKLTGSFNSSNQDGLSVQQELHMLTGIGNHYQVLPVDAGSPHDRDMANVKGALRRGYPVIICGTETGMYDLGLGDRIPYQWAPAGNHCIVATGIAKDGNLLVRDPANVDGNGVRPGPRTYNTAKLDLISAVVFVPSWMPRPDGTTDFTKDPVVSSPVVPMPVVPMPVAPLPVVPMPVAPLPVVPMPVAPLPVVPSPVAPVPVPGNPSTLVQSELLATIAMLRDGIDHLLAEISKLWL